MSPSSPYAPALAHRYKRAVPALLCRASASLPTHYTDGFTVRRVDVLGLDAAPAVATRALVVFREGKTTREAWVQLAEIASDEAGALEKARQSLSALLSPAQRPAKMPVMTTGESAAEAIKAEAAA